MPEKLTKDQKYYRKKKKEAEKDFIRLPKEGNKTGRQGTRKAICLRVSLAAAERFKQMAKDAGINQWQMASRIIDKGLPGIQTLGLAYYNYERQKWVWNEQLLNPPSRLRYKSDKGEVQLNMDITKTMWNKLHCYSHQVQRSKSRIFEELCRDYTPMTKEQRERQKTKRDEYKQYWDDWHRNRGVVDAVSQKPSKFIDTGSEIIHSKGIPPEYWDDAEFAEYEELSLKLIESLSGD